MSQLVSHDRIVRCILMMSPSTETYREMCLQMYAKSVPSTFQVDALYVRRSFRVLRTRPSASGHYISSYFYKLPNGRCDGPHLFTYAGEPTIITTFYCCNGMYHGAYTGKYYGPCKLRTTIRNGLFNGPATLTLDDVVVRRFHYVNGYICGLFTGGPALSPTLMAPQDITCTYAAVYGPANIPSKRCGHGITGPLDIHSEHTYTYRNVVRGHGHIKRVFVGGPLTGKLSYRLDYDILVECMFDGGVQHGQTRAWRLGQLFYDANFVDGVQASLAMYTVL